MNRCHALGHLALIVAGLAGAAVAFAAVPAALASASPRRARLLSWAGPPLPPGWNKHPRLPRCRNLAFPQHFAPTHPERRGGP
jgi:hypothetical protein